MPLTALQQNEQARFQIIQDLLGAARWREMKAEEYPEDRRNHDAVETLNKLRLHVVDIGIDDPRLAALVQLSNDWPAGTPLLADQLGRVGFGHWQPSDLDELLSQLIHQALLDDEDHCS